MGGVMLPLLVLALVSQDVDYGAYLPSEEQTSLWAQLASFVGQYPEFHPSADRERFDSLYVAWFGPLPEIPDEVQGTLKAFYDGEVYIMDLGVTELEYLRDYFDLLHYRLFVEHPGPGPAPAHQKPY